MKKQLFTIKILFVLTASFIFLFAGSAGTEDTSLKYKLDTKYSGASPLSKAPWLSAVFDNNEANDRDPNKMLLIMSASNLAKTESVRMWFFNFALTKSGLNFSHVSGPKAVEIDMKSNNTAGGGGYFDFRFIFSNDEFNTGETAVYEISYTSKIESANFSKLSQPGGGRGLYGSAALLYIVNGKNKIYGWIGDSGKGTTTGSKD